MDVHKEFLGKDIYCSDEEEEREFSNFASILLKLQNIVDNAEVKEIPSLPSNLTITYESDHCSDEDEEIPNSPGSKRKRQRTSPEQLEYLENMFLSDKMPNQKTRNDLSAKLGMSSRRIQVWFQNKRAKLKRVPSNSSLYSPTYLPIAMNNGSENSLMTLTSPQYEIGVESPFMTDHVSSCSSSSSSIHSILNPSPTKITKNNTSPHFSPTTSSVLNNLKVLSRLKEADEINSDSISIYDSKSESNYFSLPGKEYPTIFPSPIAPLYKLYYHSFVHI